MVSYFLAFTLVGIEESTRNAKVILRYEQSYRYDGGHQLIYGVMLPVLPIQKSVFNLLHL